MAMESDERWCKMTNADDAWEGKGREGIGFDRIAIRNRQHISEFFDASQAL